MQLSVQEKRFWRGSCYTGFSLTCSGGNVHAHANDRASAGGHGYAWLQQIAASMFSICLLFNELRQKMFNSLDQIIEFKRFVHADNSAPSQGIQW